MFKKMAFAGITGRAGLSLCVLLIMFPLSAMAASNVSVTPYLDYNYSSNIFWDAAAVSDATLSPGLNLNFTASQFNFFLNADSKIYQSNVYLNQTSVYGGFNFYKTLSKRSSFFLSPDFSLTRFKGEMAYLNTAIPSLAVGLKHVFSDQLYSRLGINLRHSNYLEEDSYDRWRMAVFLEMSAFFKTQTTLRLTLGLNYLFFPHIFMELPTVADPKPETRTAAVSPFVSLSIPQPFIVFRAAQGLGFKTGLIAEIQYRKNRNLGPDFDLLAIDEWALQQMDEDFFWQGTRLSLALKTEAIFNMEIAIDFSYYLKQYNGLDALDMNGDPLLPHEFRADRLSQVTMRVAKSLGNFGFYLTGSYRKNISNDLYFHYNSYTISTGMDYVF